MIVCFFCKITEALLQIFSGNRFFCFFKLKRMHNIINAHQTKNTVNFVRPKYILLESSHSCFSKKPSFCRSIRYPCSIMKQSVPSDSCIKQGYLSRIFFIQSFLKCIREKCHCCNRIPKSCYYFDVIFCPNLNSRKAKEKLTFYR